MQHLVQHSRIDFEVVAKFIPAHHLIVDWLTTSLSSLARL
jgi:hypothetical protein